MSNDLSTVKVGDKVVRVHHGFGDPFRTIETVERLTKTQIVLQSGEKFRLNDGNKTPSNSHWHLTYIEAVSADTIREIEETNEWKALADFLQKRQWKDYGIDALRRVKEVICPTK